MVWAVSGGRENKYRIWLWHKRDPLFADQLITYITNRAKNPTIMKKKILKSLSRKTADTEIYNMVKSDLIPETETLGRAHLYRMAQIKKYCPIKPTGDILDIGTEELSFLSEMEKAYGVRAFGVNIKGDFSHYSADFYSMDTDPRFKFYDGVNIPWPDNRFGLITMLSVAHHIPPKNLPPLLAEIKRVLRPGGYFFIKENNLSDQKYADAFDIQHEMYEGALYPGKPSYRNNKMNIKIFTKAGFKKINIVETKNFTNATYMLYSSAK